ncbi:hypothetical protein ACIPL1_30730 [Pseudomonas sp. NPDC090202]|uniref:hypothetical protein n=1 Tax=Pseudomonas sp. NPDC090202 TaxID=3364476 RepID=UPI003804F4C4
MERSAVYFQFSEKYPDAEFLGYTHENGFRSEVAVGRFQGKADEVFVGVYRQDGTRVAEHRIQDDMIDHPETLNNGDPHLPRRAGESRAEGFANSPIKQV